MLNRIFQLPKFIAAKLSRKILLPVFIIGLLIFTGFFAFNYLTTTADNKARQEETSRLAEQFFNLKLHDLNDFSLGLAVQSANNPEIQAAFAAQDQLIGCKTDVFAPDSGPVREIVVRRVLIGRCHRLLRRKTEF